MEGIEFQIRTLRRPSFTPFVDHRYPLSIEQRIQQSDQFNRSKRDLATTLASLEDSFSTSRAGPHTGGPKCEQCTAKKEKTWQAYHDFYLGNESGRWDAGLTTYRKDISSMFTGPDKPNLEVIHSRFEKELRDHLRKDLCTFQERIDPPAAIEHKKAIQAQFDEGVPTKSILQNILIAEQDLSALYSEEEIIFLDSLEKSQTAQERTKIYARYYCSSSYNDTPQQKNIKAKYERLFENGVPHDEVLSLWRQEAVELQRQEISRLKHRLAELRLAQSAHLKDKAKKAEKDHQMQELPQKKSARCNLRDCGTELDLEDEDGVLQCALCDWLTNKVQPDDETKGRAYYCSARHAEEDFDDHDHYEHRCTMHGECIHDGGPIPVDTSFSGICRDCLQAGSISYFCSQECWNANMEHHREEFHDERNEDHAQELELFQPEPDLEISPSSPMEA